MPIAIDAEDFAEKFERALQDFALNMAQRLADAAPADTGELRAGIRNGFTVKRVSKGEWHVDFNMPKQAEYIEFGTGIWGPTGAPIQPKNPDGVLAWKAGVKFRDKYGPMHNYKGSSNWYAFKSVRGIEPHPFIRPTLHQHFAKELNDALKANVK